MYSRQVKEDHQACIEEMQQEHREHIKYVNMPLINAYM